MRLKLMGSKFLVTVGVSVGMVGCWGGLALGQTQQSHETPQQLVEAMLAREEAPHTDRYEYILNERSDRTGGHLWTEHVVETSEGKIMKLIAEDGKPLSAQRQEEERIRLADLAAHPDLFARQQETQREDEAHARKLLEVLPHGFLLENVTLRDGVWRMDFRPNPDYAPNGIEEKVLHGMQGWLSIDAHDLRLIHIEGKLAQDCNIGFGLLASIHAGSSFESDRQLIDGHWRMVHVETDVRGKAALFKSVARKSDVTRTDFHYLNAGEAVPQAIALLQH